MYTTNTAVDLSMAVLLQWHTVVTHIFDWSLIVNVQSVMLPSVSGTAQSIMCCSWIPASTSLALAYTHSGAPTSRGGKGAGKASAIEVSKIADGTSMQPRRPSLVVLTSRLASSTSLHGPQDPRVVADEPVGSHGANWPFIVAHQAFQNCKNAASLSDA